MALIIKKKKKSFHTKPKSVQGIDLSQPGRLRVAHLLTLLQISHSGLYGRLKKGSVPQPDGYDGGGEKNRQSPYWFTETIRPFVSK